jgi:peroxiredoxin
MQTTRLRSLIKALLFGLGVILLLWIIGCAAIYSKMRKPPEEFGRFMARIPAPVAFMAFPFESLWTKARAGTVNVGDTAPDFTLLKTDKSEWIQLSALNRKQPVVLIFGSYTWPPFRREVPSLNHLYEQYQGKVAFLAVYITEAHPSDVWQMQNNIEDNVVFSSPRNEEERASVAGTCMRKLGIKFPAVLDEFGNSTEKNYTAWPDRIYLIDQQGRVAYKSMPGPFGFHTRDLATALSRMMQRQ